MNTQPQPQPPPSAAPNATTLPVSAQALLKPADLRLLTSNSRSDDLRFERQMVKGIHQLDGAHAERCEFVHVGLRDLILRSCSFIRCEFRHVDIRKGRLDKCDLTGTKFIECNLSQTEFIDCTLWYVEFERCVVNYESILRSLPQQNNRKHQLLRSLRLNAASAGDTYWTNALLVQELEAERADLYDRFTSDEAYYRNKYVGFNKAKQFGRWALHCMQLLLWGYGLRLGRVAFVSLLTALLLSLLTWTTGVHFYPAAAGTPRPLDFGECCGIGFGFLVGADSGFTPADAGARTISIGGSAMGLVVWGLLVAALYRRVAK